MIKDKAFTLAETLITLGIIGIVAALTLPALTAKYQEKILVTQVKKSYSELQNALKMYAAKNECSDMTCISDLNSTSEELIQKLFKQFKGAKYCEKGNKDKICSETPIKDNKLYNNGQGVAGNSDSFLQPFFVSANGAAYRGIQQSTCNRTVDYNDRDENGNFVDKDNDGVWDTKPMIEDWCATFYFDANGTNKGPNQFGADIYRINIKDNGKLYIFTTQLTKTLTTDKLYYTPYNLGVEIK